MNSNPGVRKSENLLYDNRIISWFWQTQIGISVLSLTLSLLVISALSLVFGALPWEVLSALYDGALRGQRSIAKTLVEMAPFILAGLAVLIPYKAGFFNIGGQGQLEIGALTAVLVTLTLSGPPAIVMTVALIASMVAGALVVVIPLILKIKRGASEVTTTIMMNFACIQLVYALITGVLRDPKAFYGTTHAVPVEYRLPVLFSGALGVHIGVWIAIAIALILYWMMKKTVYGVQLDAVGNNPIAAKTAGISVNKVLIGSVLSGASLAGLAGGIMATGVVYRVAEGWAKTWGFTGIPVAFLGGNALGVVPVSFILAILESGARNMQAVTGVPSALVYVFQGVPVLLFVIFNALRWKYKKDKQQG